MSGYKLVTSQGNLGSGEYDHLWVPNRPRTGKYGVVLLHGANTPDQYTGLTWPSTVELGARLANMGIPCVAGYMGGDNWDADALLTYFDNALTYMAAQTGCSSAKAHVFGTSMGGGGAWRLGISRTAKIASLVGLIPLCDLLEYYSTNPQSQSAAIAAKWGVTTRTISNAALTVGSNVLTSVTAAFTSADVGRYVSVASSVLPAKTTIVSVTDASHVVVSNNALSNVTGGVITLLDPLPAAANFSAGAATLRALPTRIYYSSGDLVLPPATTTAFAAAIGAEKCVSVGTQGHVPGTGTDLGNYGAGNWREITDYFLAHGA